MWRFLAPLPLNTKEIMAVNMDRIMQKNGKF
jgi:hypothetical protein